MRAAFPLPANAPVSQNRDAFLWTLQGIPRAFTAVITNVTPRVTPVFVDRMNHGEYASVPDIPVLIATMAPATPLLPAPKTITRATLRGSLQTGKG